MEIQKLDNDITVACVRAASFPEGIAAAYEKLHEIVPYSPGRNYFGISRPERISEDDPDTPIVYHAGVEVARPEEAEKLGLEALVLKKGDYLGIMVEHYRNNPGNIGLTFCDMLQEPNLDPEGYCVEWYVSDTDVRCMIRLRD